MIEEPRERVWREGQEWLAARIHHSAHGNWLPEDECPICQRDQLSVEDYLDQLRECAND